MIVNISIKLREDAKILLGFIPQSWFQIVLVVVICRELNHSILGEGCLLIIFINKNLFS
jgi:hypothetical protein